MGGVIDICGPGPTTRCNTVATPCHMGARVVIPPRGRSFFIFLFLFTLVVFFILLIILLIIYNSSM